VITILNFPCERDNKKKVREAGFSHPIEVRQIEGDILNYYYIARKQLSIYVKMIFDGFFIQPHVQSKDLAIK
jgi:hypothetical protein